MLPISIAIAILVTGSAYVAAYVSNDTSVEQASATTVTKDVAGALAENVAVVGNEPFIDAAQHSNSWPGEVVSYGNIPIQPGRDGTIIEWRVKIGDRVAAGQVLARLSAPPATSELVQMLAEQAEGRARMRAQAATTKRFTETNNEQLRELLRSSETTLSESQAVLIGSGSQSATANAALKKARGASAAMRRNVRTTLEQMLAGHMGIVSNMSSIALFRFGSLNRLYGASDSQNQNDYELRFMQLVEGLKDPEAIPSDLATKYFSSFVQLANTTASADLVDIRDTAADDQEKFLDMLAKYRDSEAAVVMKEAEYALMASNNTKEYAELRREVEEKIAENEKMLAMSIAEASAAEAAYATVERSINGGLAIVAPRSGVVSTINKKVGDFVGPGMPVASLDTERASERFVRLQIPNNIRTPKAGDVLSVVRPGFSQDVRKVKITGVGTSLDTTGSYMADATFLDSVDWPVASSVRVLVPQSGDTPLIKLSSVWWDPNGAPHVWGVSEAGRIFARRITIGRTIGAQVEVYAGLEKGDRYVAAPTPEMEEDMLLTNDASTDGTPANSDAEDPMKGMQM